MPHNNYQHNPGENLIPEKYMNRKFYIAYRITKFLEFQSDYAVLLSGFNVNFYA